MNWEMWVCNNILSCHVLLCWVHRVQVNHQYSNQLLVLISCQEVTVLLLEDRLSSDWTICMKRLSHGPSFQRRSQVKSSLISMKCVIPLMSLLIRFAVTIRVSLISLLCSMYTHILALIWLLLIFQVSPVFQSQDNLKTLKKSQEQWLTVMSLIAEPLFFVLYQLMLIWQHQTVCRWLVI